MAKLNTLWVLLLLAACSQQPKQNITQADTLQNNTLASTAPSTMADSSGKKNPTNEPATVNRVADAQRIIAGQRIGHIRLNMPADSVYTLLGNPDQHDAAMGTASMTWFAKHDTSGYQTNICTQSTWKGSHQGDKVVHAVRITSPWFRTDQEIHTGSTLADIQRHYHVEQIADNAKGHAMYDDLKAGIAFEISGAQKCVSILIHLPNDNGAVHINFY